MDKEEMDQYSIDVAQSFINSDVEDATNYCNHLIREVITFTWVRVDLKQNLGLRVVLYVA